jgi:hypothetical protein
MMVLVGDYRQNEACRDFDFEGESVSANNSAHERAGLSFGLRRKLGRRASCYRVLV